ncbi:MAG: hypothetical protein ACQESG_06915 [Nanobdellota archaeon]
MDKKVNDMKRMLSLFIAGLLMLSIGAFVTAQADEVAVMNSKSGAEVRLLQLEKSIEKNIVIGEKVVENILERNLQADVSEMNTILAELEVIQEEVEGMAEERLNTSQVAERFVIIREEAKSKSAEFRSMAEVSEGDKAKIREEARNNPEVEAKLQQVRQRIRQHNAAQVSDILANMGVENETLVNRVRDGELNVGEAVSQVARTFRGLGQEQKQQASAIMDTQRAQMNQHAQEAVENARRNMDQKMQERAQQREQKVEDKLQQVRQRIVERMPGFEDNAAMQNHTGGSADRPGGSQ